MNSFEFPFLVIFKKKIMLLWRIHIMAKNEGKLSTPIVQHKKIVDNFFLYRMS
jgi:hypothetical protein